LKKLIILFIFIPILHAGCTGLVERTGQMLDGSYFSEKTINIYRAQKKDGSPIDIEIHIVENRDLEKSFFITLDNFPMFKLRCYLPDANNNFSLASLDYLAGNTHGWNEYTLQLMGEGSLSLAETAALDGIKNIETVQIINGKIHRYDTRITGADALTALRNRRDRITSLALWMKSTDAPKAQNIKDFENYWKPVFFPEITAARKRPQSWRLETDKYERAESIRWNTGYTERVFSEELWQVRNSGTLLRDWEEALPWIYLEYEWESIMELLSQNIILNKVR